MTRAVAASGRFATDVERRRPIDWVGYAFVAFFTLPFLIFNVGPVLFGIYVGFTEWGIIGEPTLPRDLGAQ